MGEVRVGKRRVELQNQDIENREGEGARKKRSKSTNERIKVNKVKRRR